MHMLVTPLSSGHTQTAIATIYLTEHLHQLVIFVHHLGGHRRGCVAAALMVGGLAPHGLGVCIHGWRGEARRQKLWAHTKIVVACTENARAVVTSHLHVWKRDQVGRHLVQVHI